jgi:DNA-binding XRE family transcriptional regulator
MFFMSGLAASQELEGVPGRDSVLASYDWGREASHGVMGQLVICRRELGVKAWTVAKEMGVTPEVVYRLERCERDPRLSTVLRYARALGLELIWGSDG